VGGAGVVMVFKLNSPSKRLTVLAFFDSSPVPVWWETPITAVGVRGKATVEACDRSTRYV